MAAEDDYNNGISCASSFSAFRRHRSLATTVLGRGEGARLSRKEKKLKEEEESKFFDVVQIDSLWSIVFCLPPFYPHFPLSPLPPCLAVCLQPVSGTLDSPMLVPNLKVHKEAQS